jgi:hypothetical protein
MAEKPDDLDARRWFRQRLADLKAQYPQLTMPAAQARLADTLDTMSEEDTPCPDIPPVAPEAAP